MPRPNPPRSLQSEDNLARRVAYEREQRGWTYDGLAKRLTKAGCPIQGSAIYKIEKGNPRRRISVDELVAFAQVFDIGTEDLLIPLELIAENEILKLLTELEQKYQVLSTSADDCSVIIERIGHLVSAMDDEHAEDILCTLWKGVGDTVFALSTKNKEGEKALSAIINKMAKIKNMRLSRAPGFFEVRGGEHPETS